MDYDRISWQLLSIQKCSRLHWLSISRIRTDRNDAAKVYKVLISLFDENISNTELWVKLYFCYWVRDRKLNQIHNKRTQKVYSTTNIMWYNNTYQPNNVWDVRHQTAIPSSRRRISYRAHIQTLRQSPYSAILFHKIIFCQWITYQDISFQNCFINNKQIITIIIKFLYWRILIYIVECIKQYI